MIPARFKFYSVSKISLAKKDLTREDNIFGKTLDFYPLEIIAKIGDVTLKETVEILLIDMNNNAPEATLEYKNVCRTLKPNQGKGSYCKCFSIRFVLVFSLISVSDKDDCTLGNCAPYTFEIRGPHGPNAMRHAFTVARHRDYTKCSNETTPFGCYSIRYTGDPQILRSVFKLMLCTRILIVRYDWHNALASHIWLKPSLRRGLNVEFVLTTTDNNGISARTSFMVINYSHMQITWHTIV